MISRSAYGVLFGVVAASGLLVGCGGGGGSNAATGFDSAEDLVAAMDAPTGTVDATTVGGVAAAYEEQTTADIGSSPFGGSRDVAQKLQAESAEIACTGGGSIKAEGDETAVDATYDNCVEGDCTINGDLSFFSTGAGEYSTCLSYDISATCGADSFTAAYSGCLDGTGTFTYLIDVDGETYTVSGYYSGGNGELTISGANGTWTCTYTDNAGTCVGTDGAADFTF